MNLFVDALSLFMQTSAQMGTHILLATLGGILCEKAGNMNLGIEGMMLLGASVGFSAALATGNPALAVLAAGLAGACGAFIYAAITVTLRGNQVPRRCHPRSLLFPSRFYATSPSLAR